ncbi:hypothetical protein SAMN05216420_101435 [Nitrosospira sp. Nl5]|uniref:hypothetical protein n=1 Tax=Nitrosospira sp. Nl5 TaxID=200120 RepID=UPI00087FFAE5|nr:hypothetical protein [Nitrosospira sp. Nl5]SCX95331.1 hypothetical protein SAMN05216420_101435 [Nitrosospira sp. Nl5]
MVSRKITFPCPVRRISVVWREGAWIIENDIRVRSMTLPKSDELPEAARGRGVTGFWYEAVDRQGRTIYRQVMEDPFLGMEVFGGNGGNGGNRGNGGNSDNGRIRRIKTLHRQVSLEILVPDVPDLDALHIYSSNKPSPHEVEAQEMPRERKAERIAVIHLHGEKGGEHGHQ